MTDRVRREWIESQLNQIEEMTGIRLKVETWSPKYGVTRYTILSDKETSISRVALGAGECFDMLKAINDFTHYVLSEGVLVDRTKKRT